jgi:hypothetical protein
MTRPTRLTTTTTTFLNDYEEHRLQCGDDDQRTCRSDQGDDDYDDWLAADAPSIDDKMPGTPEAGSERRDEDTDDEDEDGSGPVEPPQLRLMERWQDIRVRRRETDDDDDDQRTTRTSKQEDDWMRFLRERSTAGSTASTANSMRRRLTKKTTMTVAAETTLDELERIRQAELEKKAAGRGNNKYTHRGSESVVE